MHLSNHLRPSLKILMTIYQLLAALISIKPFSMSCLNALFANRVPLHHVPGLWPFARQDQADTFFGRRMNGFGKAQMCILPHSLPTPLLLSHHHKLLLSPTFHHDPNRYLQYNPVPSHSGPKYDREEDRSYPRKELGREYTSASRLSYTHHNCALLTNGLKKKLLKE